MTFRRDSSTKKKRVIKYTILTTAIFLSWFLFESFINNPLEKSAFFVSGSSNFLTNRLHAIYLYAASNNALYEENIRLNNELQAEKQRYIEVKELRDRITNYEKIVPILSDTSIFARRIGPIDSLLHESFRINKGFTSGVVSNQKVITQEKVIVGKVEEVGNNTSVVSLLWNGETFLARLSSNGAVLSIKGTENGVYKADVSHELDIKIDDVILLDENPDFIVGIVKKINNNEEGLFKEVIIHTPIHPRMINVVMLQ